MPDSVWQKKKTFDLQLYKRWQTVLSEGQININKKKHSYKPVVIGLISAIIKFIAAGTKNYHLRTGKRKLLLLIIFSELLWDSTDIWVNLVLASFLPDWTDMVGVFLQVQHNFLSCNFSLHSDKKWQLSVDGPLPVDFAHQQFLRNSCTKTQSSWCPSVEATTRRLQCLHSVNTHQIVQCWVEEIWCVRVFAYMCLWHGTGLNRLCVTVVPVEQNWQRLKMSGPLLLNHKRSKINSVHIHTHTQW